MSQVAAIQSAQTVAALRAAVTNETSLAVACEDCLAKCFISLRERILTAILPQPLLRWVLEHAAPGSYGFAIARTRCFDDALLSEAADGIEQVVILGAGYDSRALRFANELKHVRVFEVDHPGTQARKTEHSAALEHRGSEERPVRPCRLQPRRARGRARQEGLLAHPPYAVPVGGRLLLPARNPSSPASWRFVAELRVRQLDRVRLRAAHVRRGRHQHLRRRGSSRSWLRKIGEPFVFGLNPHETPHFLGECGLKPVYDIEPRGYRSPLPYPQGRRHPAPHAGARRIVHARNVK